MKTFVKYTLRRLAWTAVLCMPLLLSAANRDSLTVSVAYGSQPEWKRTASLSSISGEELLKTTSANVGNALQGRLPGLTLLQTSGEPGYDFNRPGALCRCFSPRLPLQPKVWYNSGKTAGMDFARKGQNGMREMGV